MIISIVHLLSSCQEFLDEKPSKDIVVPKTAQDIEALLTNYSRFNINPLITFVLGPDYETTTAQWEGLNPWQQQAYLWQDNIFGPLEGSVDYQYSYTQVFYANLSLDLLEEGIEGEIEKINELRGLALFLRAYAYSKIAMIHLPIPGSKLNNGSYQIPLKLVSDITQKAAWAGVDQVYDQIINDLEMAVQLLPAQVPNPIYANKTAAQALLAQIYLVAGDFEQSANMAMEVIDNGPDLLDYNQLDSNKEYPFELFNQETLYYAKTDGKIDITASSSTLIPEALYASYADNDLRKALFFQTNQDGRQLFYGSYTGGYNLFTGISLSEAYLIGAESLIRRDRLEEGLEVLNRLMENRIKAGEYIPLETDDPQEALQLIWQERKKELVFRGRSWEDFKRMGRDGQGQHQASRTINGQEYSITPDDLRTIIKIPEMELELEGQL
ncbi:hypothetical protein GCM10028791_40910 [Echinicola sediminis]